MPLFHREEKFDKTKVKTSMKMAITRLNMQKNKRENQLKLQKREIANLLAQNKNESARIKVEAVIRDAYMIEALELLTLFIDLLSTRLQLLVESRTCPPDMKEAVSTVIWACPRVENVPELLQIREQLARKFGKEFAHAASDNSEMAVNVRVHERMSMLVPEPYLCIETLKDIAQQFDIEWNSESIHAEIPASGLGSGVATMPDPMSALPVPPCNNPNMAPTHNPNHIPGVSRDLGMPPSDPSGGPSMGYQPPPVEPDLLGPPIMPGGGAPPPPLGGGPEEPYYNTPGNPHMPPGPPSAGYNPNGPGAYQPPSTGYGAVDNAPQNPAMGGAPPPAGGGADFSDLEARLEALKRGNL